MERMGGTSFRRKRSLGSVYDDTEAIDLEKLLNGLHVANLIVEGADSLGKKRVAYIIEASSALSINDEVAVAKAFTTLHELFSTSSDGLSGAEKLGKSMSDVLPEPTSTMKQFWRIVILVGARGNNSDPSKLVPIFRKFSQEQRLQQVR